MDLILLLLDCLLLGPYSRAISRPLRWSGGGGALSYERGTPVTRGIFLLQEGWRVDFILLLLGCRVSAFGCPCSRVTRFIFAY